MKCGPTAGVAVPVPTDDIPDDEPCRVYVKYHNIDDAKKCKDMMDGRDFDDRKVKASFSNEFDFMRAQQGEWITAAPAIQQVTLPSPPIAAAPGPGGAVPQVLPLPPAAAPGMPTVLPLSAALPPGVTIPGVNAPPVLPTMAMPGMPGVSIPGVSIPGLSMPGMPPMPGVASIPGVTFTGVSIPGVTMPGMPGMPPGM